jgi:uncharacterized protein
MDEVKLEKLKQRAEKEMKSIQDPTHDMSHVLRVYELAMNIAQQEENVDMNILQPAVLLHDIGRYAEIIDSTGQTDHAEESAKMAKPILQELDFDPEQIKHIQGCIISHRYKTENKPETIEAQILFDADKLDSLGAIGVARAYCWIGKHNANLYRKVDIDEYIKQNMGGKKTGRIQDKTKHSPQIEFEVKYKHIIDKLFTESAKKICQERTSYFKKFLDRMEQEVTGVL